MLNITLDFYEATYGELRRFVKVTSEHADTDRLEAYIDGFGEESGWTAAIDDKEE